MYRPFLAFRFIRSRVIVWLGILSIAASVMVFIVVMGVLEGFSEQLRDMVRRTTSHVEISRQYVGGLADWETIAGIASRQPRVVGITPYVQGMALIQSQRFRFYGIVKGIDWEREKKFGHITGYTRIPLTMAEIQERSGLSFGAIESALERLTEEKVVKKIEDFAYRPVYQRAANDPKLRGGDERKVFDALKRPPEKITSNDPDAPPGIPAIIVGDRIWAEMGLCRGELIRVSVLAGEEADMVKQSFIVMGEFKTGSQLFDNWMLINLPDAQKLCGMNGNVHGVGIWLDDYTKSGQARDRLKEVLEDPATIASINDHFPGEYRVRSWMDQQGDLFNAISIENRIMRLIFILFFLLIGVFVLTIMYVMVTEKVRDIGILMAIGARVRGVMGIFLADGFFVGVVGAAIGLIAGQALAWNVNEVTTFLHLNVFPKEIFKVERIPVTIFTSDLLLVGLVAIGTSILASLYPAFRAARMNPVESLRHE